MSAGRGGFRIALVTLAGGFALAAAGPARALDVVVAGPGETLPADSLHTYAAVPAGDTLIAAFRVTESLEGAQRPGEGIPATLLLVVDLWKKRDGWWDSLVRSQAILYRFQVNVWTGAAEFRDLDGTVIGLPDRAALAARLERVHEVVLGRAADFDEGSTYYLSVKALLRPMKLEDLQEVDAWLSGRVTGSGGGGVLGIPKGVARVLFGAAGLGDRSAVGRSRDFVPR